MNQDFLEHCILHASNLLPMVHDHYADVMRVMVSLNTPKSSPSEVPLMYFLIGIDMMKTFGIGNRWPIFCDTIIPEIRKNLNMVNPNYVIRHGALNSIPADQKESFKDLQYCFYLNVECVIKTFLTNPIFTAQYLIEKEHEVEDLLSSCEYLLKEINFFIGLKNGLPDSVTAPLVSELKRLVTQDDLLKDNSKDTGVNPADINGGLSSSEKSFLVSDALSSNSSITKNKSVSNCQSGLFYYNEKEDEESSKIELRNTLT